MTFSSKAKPQGRSAAVAFLATILGALSLGLIAACGGSTSQVEVFRPGRLLAFGDDTSTLTQTGRKYGVNALNASSGGVDCSSEPIWVQSVAASYGFAFAECNPTSIEPKAFMRAFPGAKVDDVAAQVEAQVAAGGFRANDLATVLAGSNDILELYAQYPSRSVDSLLAESSLRGQQLAAVVNRLVALGVKVVVSDLPDLGLSPYARAQQALDPSGLNRADLISRMVSAFNQQLGVKVLLDGRFVGLAQTELRFKAIGTAPGAFGFNNISEGLCLSPVPTCTTATLLTGSTTTGYLWADDTRLSPGGHSQLASLAIDRAQRNPF